MTFSILILDDDDQITQSLDLVLRNKYQVYTANTEDKLFSLIHSQEISLVIIDYELKNNKNGIDGY